MEKYKHLESWYMDKGKKINTKMNKKIEKL